MVGVLKDRRWCCSNRDFRRMALILSWGIRTCNGYVYSIGGAILDIDNPSIVKYRCENFLLTPEEWYEERGFVPNVCFPCATIHDSASGKIAIYYGAADSYVGLAFTKLDEIVDYIKTNSVVTPADTEIGRR